MQIADAFDLFRRVLTAGEGGEQHAGQNRNNRNYHQELDQCEAGFPGFSTRLLLLNRELKTFWTKTILISGQVFERWESTAPTGLTATSSMTLECRPAVAAPFCFAVTHR
jgi:hypothetical protein